MGLGGTQHTDYRTGGPRSKRAVRRSAGLALAGKDAGIYGVRVGAWLDASAMIAILASLAWALAVVIERRSVERGLAQHAFLAMSQMSADAVVTVDGHGTIRYVNRGGEAMFGYEPAELVGAAEEHTRGDRHPPRGDGAVEVEAEACSSDSAYWS